MMVGTLPLIILLVPLALTSRDKGSIGYTFMVMVVREYDVTTALSGFEKPSGFEVSWDGASAIRH